MRAFVDRIESGFATLLLGDDESVTVQVPHSWLPAGAKEGAVLRLDLSLDEAAQEEGKRSTQSLLEELGDRP
jgi:hypothetical protein